MTGLPALLPSLMPRAIAWARHEESIALDSGRALDAHGISIAHSVAVAHPQRVRVVVAASLPYPSDPVLAAAARQAGLLGPHTNGLTLGYAIFLTPGNAENPRLLSHELRHVQQYEQLGGIAGFLPVYLQQIMKFGYFDAPLEQDARAHE